MTHITKALLSLTLLFVACDKEETAEPSEQELAEVEDGHRGGWMARLDADQDGAISREEAKGHHRLEAKFAELDSDSDGKLTREELKAMRGHHGERGWHKDPEKRAAKLLSKFDANSDGAISRDEVGDHPHLAEKFAEADADKDGKLTREELKALKGPPGRGPGHHPKDPAERAAWILADLDANSDGALSADEVAEHPPLAAQFAEVDSDKDGKLTREELAALKGPPGHGEGHRKDPAERAARMMAKLDANGDGALSAAEVADHPHLAEKFAEADSDKDGKLTRDELTAFKAAHHGEKRRGPRGE